MGEYQATQIWVTKNIIFMAKKVIEIMSSVRAKFDFSCIIPIIIKVGNIIIK